MHITNVNYKDTGTTAQKAWSELCKKNTHKELINILKHEQQIEP